jgi:hypothetical protein
VSNNDFMTREDFVAQYQVMSDEEITQLASEGGLLPEADAALRSEMRKRSIGATEVRSLRIRQKKAELQMWVGHNPYSYRGTGLRLRGHKFLTEADRKKGIIAVTRWIVFIFMPLIPIGSYRVKESIEGDSNPQIIGKVRLQWDQVLEGWKKAAIIILAFVGALAGFAWWGISHSQGK